MDPPIEIDVLPPETPSIVAGIENPDNAGWIKTIFYRHRLYIITFFEKKNNFFFIFFSKIIVNFLIK